MELGEIQLGQVIDGLVLECGRGKSISGRVLWPEGEAASGATVRMEELGSERQWWDDNASLKTEADEAGAFEITGLSGDEVYRVYTRAKRTKGLALEGLSKLKRKRALKAAPFWNAELERVEAGSTEVVLTLRSGAVFKGTVVDDQGTPIEKFRVTARPADDDGDFFGRGGGESITQIFDKAEGSFELEGLKPGSWDIGVFRAGYGPAKSITARVPGGPLSGEFVLARDAIVRGRVLDPDGKPVEGATVNCELVDSDAGPFTFGSRGETTSKTDEEGRFELKRVSPGPSEISAEGAVIGAVDSKVEVREVPPASEVEGVVLTLRRGARVVARVHPSLLDRPNLEININELEGPMYRTESPDESGVCTFEVLNPGRYRMRLEIPAPEEGSVLPEGVGDDERSLEFELAEGEDREVEIGTPPSVTYTVTGTVLRRGGEPFVGARVQIVTREDDRNYGVVTSVSHPLLHSDSASSSFRWKATTARRRLRSVARPDRSTRLLALVDPVLVQQPDPCHL
ncbi:MAG: carboxypeptidase-like regulatory domain-containing protein, partial [Planctomycetota bacterium]